MAAVSQGWKLKCDQCGYLTTLVFRDPQHAREVLRGREWECQPVSSATNPHLTQDVCRICVLREQLAAKAVEPFAEVDEGKDTRYAWDD